MDIFQPMSVVGKRERLSLDSRPNAAQREGPLPYL